MIEFEKFISEKTFIAPVIQGYCQYNRKKYSLETFDGWYAITVKGNAVIAYEPVVAEMKKFDRKITIKGYIYNNNNILFQNFDVAKKKTRHNVMAPIYLNMSPSFSSVEAIVWEDKNIYYYKPDYSDIQIYKLKEYFDAEKSIQKMKSITPELRTLYLFHDIERQKIKYFQEIAQKNKEEEAYKKTFQGRLFLLFNRAGATILQYSIQKNTAVIDWSLQNSDQQFNSVIELDTFRVIESGFCMSSDDKRHSASSMIITAKEYDEKNLIYKTRM